MAFWKRTPVTSPEDEVSIGDVVLALQEGSHILVDVREPDEWASGHVAGAMHIPLGQLPKRLNEIPADKPVYTMCRSGVRSLLAVEVLNAAGRNGTRSMAGGVLDWVDAGNPLVR